MDLLERYLREMRDIRAVGAGLAETSYYPALATLLDGAGRAVAQGQMEPRATTGRTLWSACCR